MTVELKMSSNLNPSVHLCVLQDIPEILHGKA